MIKNYFKTAWRNMLRNKVSSFINISGLSIGVACALLIVIFIRNELSYDRFHKDANRIFQVVLNGNFNGQEFWAGNTPPPVGAALTSNIPEIESQLESKWKSFVSAEPFDYNFLDTEFDAQYRSEQRLGSIFSIFAGLSIFIACLGLFGLSAFMAERRTKEIGVRKVLGASVQNVVVLLSKDFLKLTIVATIIAFPVAWYFMNKWLEDFAYRVNITWTIFLIGGLSTLMITLVTISFQAIKAAVANPVKSLRTE